MTDVVSKATRSRMMSGIRGANTSPELIVRKFLFAAGFRYRLHVSRLAGRPDIVLPKLRSVVFVHGCFWHRHPRCKYAYMPKSNVVFWKKKFAANVDRDRVVKRLLRRAGWRVHVVWECQADDRRLSKLVSKLNATR